LADFVGHWLVLCNKLLESSEKIVGRDEHVGDYSLIRRLMLLNQQLIVQPCPCLPSHNKANWILEDMSRKNIPWIVYLFGI